MLVHHSTVVDHLSHRGYYPFRTIILLSFISTSFSPSRHVLSAAHCLNSELWFVRLGEYDFTTIDDGPHEDILILRWQQHQQYNARLIIHDLGMIYLARDVFFNGD